MWFDDDRWTVEIEELGVGTVERSLVQLFRFWESRTLLKFK